MNRCPISYEECGADRYSPKGMRMLSYRLTGLRDLEFTAEEQRQEAVRRASKMSIQGVQPKLSARLNVKKSRFSVVNSGGIYILKPQNVLYPQLPQNEDLTMRMALLAGIEVPFHGMVYGKDGALTYFVKRFDRRGNRGKLAVEDFAQLAGRSRETKYDYSMEKLADVLDRFCTFPAVQKVELFRRVLFSYLTGNEDMHLKNYSVIRRGGNIELSPAYDLLNTTIVLGPDAEEIALPVDGRKRNLTRRVLVDYYGMQRLGLNRTVTDRVLSGFIAVLPVWQDLIRISFLSDSLKAGYLGLVEKRAKAICL